MQADAAVNQEALLLACFTAMRRKQGGGASFDDDVRVLMGPGSRESRIHEELEVPHLCYYYDPWRPGNS
jgi:hypothetical protein